MDTSWGDFRRKSLCGNYLYIYGNVQL